MPTHASTAVLALALLLPAAAPAQDEAAQQHAEGCEGELAQLDSTVDPAELSESDREAYADLSETARQYLAQGNQPACVETVGLIRRHLYMSSADTPDDDEGTATTGGDSE